MQICWQCATRLSTRTLAIRQLAQISSRRQLHQERLTLTEQIRAFPFPPKTSGNIRTRLAKWQEDSGKTLSDPIAADAEAQKLQALIQRDEEEDVGGQLGSASMFESEAGEITDIQLRTYVLPGSLVEITPRYSVRDPIFAVILGECLGRQIVLTINGRIISIKNINLQWHQPRWMDPEELSGLDPYLPADELINDDEDIQIHDFGVPREITAPIISKLNAFRNETLKVYGKHAETLDNAHDLLADPVELQFGTLLRIAQKLVGGEEKEMTPEVLYAVRKALHRYPIGFNSFAGSQRRTQLWQIRPKGMVRDVEQARKWLRQYRDALAADESRNPQLSAKMRHTEGFRTVNTFIKWCQKLIDESRKARPRGEHGLMPDRTNQKCSVEPRKGKEFSENNSLLIRFLEKWCVQLAFQHDQSLAGLPSFLLTSIGRYDDMEPTLYTGILLLQELGCLPPYANHQHLKPELMLPDRGLSVRLDQVYNSVQKTPKSATMQDSMKDLRFDWGDLLVFCIDDSGADDIDDGVSIEPYATDLTKHWIRVHVANPSAFFSPNSNVGAMARQLGGSFYAPDQLISMLPPISRERFSLKSGAPTLTFSFLMDSTGNISETDVRAGQIHNVVSVNYDVVDRIIGYKAEGPTRSPPLVVGATEAQISQAMAVARNKTTLDDINDNHRDMLLKLRELMSQRRSQRVQRGALIDTPGATRTLRLYKSSEDLHQSIQLPTRFNSNHSLHYDGDPVIHIQGGPALPKKMVPYHDPIRESRHMIAELMITAGTIAGEWSWARKLPQPYRTQMLKCSEDEIARYRAEVVDPLFANKSHDNTTWSDALMGIQGRLYYLPAFSMARPAKHYAIGVSTYVKATSPLRRYSDLLAHWQIEAALRHEASTGKSLITNDRSRPLPASIPFNGENIEGLIWRMVDRERMLKSAELWSIKHWTALLFHRALYSPSANQTQTPDLTPDAPFRVIVSDTKFTGLRNGEQIVAVDNEAHGLTQYMLRDHSIHTATNGIALFDVWECVLDRVDASRCSVFVRPIRLVERADEAALRAFEAARLRLSKMPPQTPALTL